MWFVTFGFRALSITDSLIVASKSDNAQHRSTGSALKPFHHDANNKAIDSEWASH